MGDSKKVLARFFNGRGRDPSAVALAKEDGEVREFKLGAWVPSSFPSRFAKWLREMGPCLLPLKKREKTFNLLWQLVVDAFDIPVHAKDHAVINFVHDSAVLLCDFAAERIKCS
jgi:hypothetical protein